MRRARRHGPTDATTVSTETNILVRTSTRASIEASAGTLPLPRAAAPPFTGFRRVSQDRRTAAWVLPHLDGSAERAGQSPERRESLSADATRLTPPSSARRARRRTSRSATPARPRGCRDQHRNSRSRSSETDSGAKDHDVRERVAEHHHHDQSQCGTDEWRQYCGPEFESGGDQAQRDCNPCSGHGRERHAAS
jgi:hypothetical protein